jgi:cell division inhibitor SulA
MWDTFLAHVKEIAYLATEIAIFMLMSEQARWMVHMRPQRMSCNAWINNESACLQMTKLQMTTVFTSF